MNTQPLPELIAQSQQLLAEIRNHPQFKALRFDCDVALGDVKQYSVNQKVFLQKAIAEILICFDTF